MLVNYIYQRPAYTGYHPYGFMDQNCASACGDFNQNTHLWMLWHRRLEECHHNWLKRINNPPTPPQIMHSTEDSHSFDCACADCQSKFGSLPVLVQGIDSQDEPLNLSGPSTSRTDPIPEPVESLGQEETKTEPSTSKGKRASTKVFKCPKCDNSYNHRGDFNKHFRKHSGEKPYQCPLCKRMFAHTSNLSRHLKVHSGDKPFGCDNCGKSFARKDKLEAHRMTRLCRMKGLFKSDTN